MGNSQMSTMLQPILNRAVWEYNNHQTLLKKQNQSFVFIRKISSGDNFCATLYVQPPIFNIGNRKIAQILNSQNKKF